MPGTVTRRAMIIGSAAVVVLGAGVAGVDANIIPGRDTMFKVLGLDGPAGHIPNITPGTGATGSFVSQKRLGAKVNWQLSYPPGYSDADKLPVLIGMHGYGGSHRSLFGGHLGLDRFLAQAVKDGAAPFAVAACDAGNSYYHLRKTGEDAGAMITDEFIPILARQGLDTSRVALLGFSMGGFGVLHVGMKLGSGQVKAIVAESPALWPDFAKSAHGAFDDAADFDANTPLGKQAQLDGVGMHIDCGTGDGFCATAQKYAAGFTTKPAGGFTAGGHNLAYWRRLAPAQLKFVAQHLSA